MENQNSFHYTYSAPENREVLNIRNKYMPRELSKLEELKRLDSLVQSSGVRESLCAGIGGILVFGLGYCLAARVIGNIPWLGLILGITGTVSMIVAFPVYRKRYNAAKQTHTPRILELSAELTGEI